MVVGYSPNDFEPEIGVMVAKKLKSKSNLTRYGLKKKSFEKIRRELHLVLKKEKYRKHLGPFATEWTKDGGTLDQYVLFTLFEAKYNSPPISIQLVKDQKYVTDDLHSCIPSTADVSICVKCP